MVQWQEYPPATSVARVQIPVMTPTMSEMSLFLILSLTLSGFLWLLQFFCPQKPGMVHEEPLCVCGYATSKSLFIFIIIIKSFVVRMLDNFWYWRFRMQMLDSPVQLLVR